jgi:hypothetical protein
LKCRQSGGLDTHDDGCSMCRAAADPFVTFCPVRRTGHATRALTALRASAHGRLATADSASTSIRFIRSTEPRRVIMESVKFFDMGAASELTKGPPGDYNEGLETQYDQD